MLSDILFTAEVEALTESLTFLGTLVTVSTFRREHIDQLLLIIIIEQRETQLTDVTACDHSDQAVEVTPPTTLSAVS